VQFRRCFLLAGLASWSGNGAFVALGLGLLGSALIPCFLEGILPACLFGPIPQATEVCFLR